MALAADCYRLALLSTVLFNRFSSSPFLPPHHMTPSAAPWYSSQPSPSTALLSRGYSLMARILDYASDAGGNHAGWNGSGTLFAPSDSAFRSHRRLPLYPSLSILHYHTARMPSLLSVDIAIMPPGSSLPTLSRRRRCLFFRQTAAGELCIAETPFRRSHPCVKISDPDIFHDGNLAIHGIHGVLDHSIAHPCGPGTGRRSPHIDAAVSELRRRGYAAVADAMLLRRSELERLPGVTVFAPNYIDGGDAEGFREALGGHVVPRRYELHDLARLAMGQRIQTIASSREIVVGSDAEGAVTVDGISIDGDAIYRNRWAVILPLRRQIASFHTPTPEESPLESVGGPLGGDGVAFGASSDYMQESSNGRTKKAGDGGRQSENSVPPRGVDPVVTSPEDWCQANVTPSFHHVSPCTAFNTAPAVGEAAAARAVPDL